MKRTKNKLSAWGIFILTGAFLLLGFCPLRNVLVRLAQPEPARKTQPVPDYAKITSGKECVTFNAVFQQVAHPGLLTVSAFYFAGFHSVETFPVSSKATLVLFSNVPIYLRNRFLLI